MKILLINPPYQTLSFRLARRQLVEFFFVTLIMRRAVRLGDIYNSSNKAQS